MIAALLGRFEDIVKTGDNPWRSKQHSYPVCCTTTMCPLEHDEGQIVHCQQPLHWWQSSR